MYMRIFLFVVIMWENQSKAAWQGFQRYHFNTRHPWSYQPHTEYVNLLNGLVSWEYVPLLRPYASFNFSHSSACHQDWRSAWSEITHNHCQWNSWGPIEEKCSRDLFVVLPCENEVLGMSADVLAQHAKDFEDFLASESERKQSQALNNKYAAAALERVSKIYSAFHERKAFEKREAFKGQVRQKLGAPHSEAMKEIEGKRQLKLAYEQFNDEFLNIVEQNRFVVDQWNEFKSIKLTEEKTRITQYSQELSAIMTNPSLTSDAFRSNARTLINTASVLDKDILAWDELTQKLSAYKAELDSRLSAFKAASFDNFWTGARGENDSLLAANHSYVLNLSTMVSRASKRATELRDFRQQYVSILQAYQSQFMERIALNEVQIYAQGIKELELQIEFSETIERLTFPVYDKSPKAEALHLPYLYQRYQILVKIREQKYLCTGNLENWKKDPCELGIKRIAAAEYELENIKNRTFEIYKKILIRKAEGVQVDARQLKKLGPVIDSRNFEEALQLYDAVLTETDRMIKVKKVQP